MRIALHCHGWGVYVEQIWIEGWPHLEVYTGSVLVLFRRRHRHDTGDSIRPELILERRDLLDLLAAHYVIALSRPLSEDPAHLDEPAAGARSQK